MEEKWIDHKKKEIYFLEWLSQASGFTEEQILKNMKPQNQKWGRNVYLYKTIDEIKNRSRYEWLHLLFFWKESFLNNSEFFWANIEYDWVALLKQYSSKNYKVLFSKYPILNWKIQKIIKLKFKNLKI